MEIGEIVFCEALQRVYHGHSSADEIVTEVIRFPFESSCEHGAYRRQKESNGAKKGSNQQETHIRDLLAEAKGLVKKRPVYESVDEIQEDKRNGLRKNQLLYDVPLLPVSCLMGQNGEYLVGRMGFEQGIVQYDAFCLAEARKVGVCVLAPFSRVDLENPAGFQSHSCHEGNDGFFQSFIFNGLEFVEKGCYQERIEPNNEHLEDGKEKPGP